MDGLLNRIIFMLTKSLCLFNLINDSPAITICFNYFLVVCYPGSLSACLSTYLSVVSHRPEPVISQARITDFKFSKYFRPGKDHF